MKQYRNKSSKLIMGKYLVKAVRAAKRNQGAVMLAELTNAIEYAPRAYLGRIVYLRSQLARH